MTNGTKMFNEPTRLVNVQTCTDPEQLPTRIHEARRRLMMGREMQGGSSKTTTFPDTLPAAPPTPGVNCYFVFLLFIYFNRCTPTSQLSLPLWAQRGPAAALCVLQKRGLLAFGLP